MASDDQLEWSADGDNIKSPDALALIEAALNSGGPILLQHWYFFGSSAPDYFVFNDFEDLVAYLNCKTKPGDAIDVWDLDQFCKHDNRLVGGKIPDSQGRVPRGGAY